MMMFRQIALYLTLLAAPVFAQRPTPEATPTPRVTPTPDPVRPTATRTPGQWPAVTAARAPADYKRDRDRGTVELCTPEMVQASLCEHPTRNYSFQSVKLPATRPLIITGCNFAQDLAQTVVFRASDGRAVRDFEGITFVECNLRNTWLPSVLGPTLERCNVTQADMPTPTPEPTP